MSVAGTLRGSFGSALGRFRSCLRPLGPDGRARILGAASTVALSAAASGVVPDRGVDASWRAGLSLAVRDGLDFGPQVLFPYGPLGFLDYPDAMAVGPFALGVLFAILSAVVLFLALDAALSRIIRRPWSSPAAVVLAAALTVRTDPALGLLLAAPVFALLTLHDGSRRAGRWAPIGLAVLAAVLLPTKFTDGAFVALFAGLAAVGAHHQPLRRAVQTAAAFLLAFLTVWTVAGQSLADVGRWLTGSLQISTGYAEAMGAEYPTGMLSYVLAAVLAAAVVAGTWRWSRPVSARSRAAIGLVTLAALYIGFKEGFVRHDLAHQVAFFGACVVLLAVVAPAWRHRSSTLVPVAVALAMTGVNVLALDPATAARNWASTTAVLFNGGYRTQLLSSARQHLLATYRLSDTMRAEVGDRPAFVDPWETAAAWAYRLNLRPVPIFQTFTAYTTALDRANATALTDAPSDQQVLRQHRSLGPRNSLWSTPRYTLALLCHYRVRDADPNWMLLTHTANRCGAVRTIRTLQVRAGDQVPVPTAGPHQLVVARFDAAEPGLADRAMSWLWRPPQRLTVTADSARYLVPHELAAGPLLCALPDQLDWPADFRGGTPYRTLRFSQPGRVQFQTITMTPMRSVAPTAHSNE